MIKKLIIRKLHGYLDKKIEFKEKENYLIGINGCGKSSVLTIINSILTKNYSYLNKIEFEKIEVYIDDSVFVIDKNNINNIEYNLNINVISEGLEEVDTESKITNLINNIKISEDDSFEKQLMELVSPIKKAEKILINEIGKYFLNMNNMNTTVSEKIKTIFPDGDIKLEKLDIDTLKDLTNTLNSRNVFEKQSEKYINDCLSSINVFLKDSYKEIVFDKKVGKIKINILNENKQVIMNLLNISKLSSGEKHIIVLITYLFFGLKDNSIILIDEPEKSLHVEWQQNFMKEILKIINSKKNIQIIIATHSPYILKNTQRENIIGMYPYSEVF